MISVMQKKLHKLGLSRLEAKAYLYLAKSGEKNAKEIAKGLEIVTQAVYRPLRGLIEKGFVVPKGKHPADFYTLPIEIGANSLITKLQERISNISKKERVREIALPFQIITSRKVHRILGDKNLKRAKKEVLVIASGTGEFSPDFTKTMFDMAKRGVDHRVIVLNLGKVNGDRLKYWKKNKFKIRYRKGRGVNLVIYDRDVVQMGFRLKEESKEKIGFIIKNKSLAGFLGEFYDYLWSKSMEI